MNLKESFNRIMRSNINVALATSVENQPNVRVVTFGYDESDEGILYFTTFPENNKIKEFEANDKVCAVAISNCAEEEVQVRINGIVKKSDKKVADVARLILKKESGFQALLDQAGDVLLIYEIRFQTAVITIGMTPPQTLIFGE